MGCVVNAEMECRADAKRVLFFQREYHSEGVYVNRFSVGNGNDFWNGATRTVVKHVGGNNGRGRWHCSKCGTRGCEHITHARDRLLKVVESAEEGEGEEGDIDGAIDLGEWANTYDQWVMVLMRKTS